MLRPTSAAREMAGSGHAAFFVSFETAICVLYVCVACSVLYAETIPGGGIPRHRTLAAVWDEWNSTPGLSPPTVIALVVFGLTHAMMLFAAWLLLPNVHRAGGVIRAYGKSCRAVGAGVGVLATTVIIVSICILIIEYDNFAFFLEPLKVVLAVYGMLGVIVWVSKACAAVGEPESPIQIEPRCEDCGYDLSHRPADGICPECGTSIEQSLTRGVRRVRSTWERRPDMSSWLKTSIEVLRAPRQFYRRLAMRPSVDRSRSFATRHHVFIGMGAWLWITIMLMKDRPEGSVLLLVPVLVAGLASVAGWALRRIVGAAAASFWLAGRSSRFPDTRWIARVIDFEAAWLWTFCAFNGTFLTLLIQMGPVNLGWLNLGFVSIPLEFAIGLVGNGALIGLWLLRFRLAGSAIRWANF